MTARTNESTSENQFVLLEVVNLEFHPGADRLIPRMRPSEMAALLADVKERGIVDPICVAPDGVTVLDGRHRVLAARELGIKVIRAVKINLEGNSDDR